MHNNSLSFQSPKLSGIGRQLDQLDNSNDPDRVCKASCQDSTIPQRFFFEKNQITLYSDMTTITLQTMAITISAKIMMVITIIHQIDRSKFDGIHRHHPSLFMSIYPIIFRN